MRKVIITSLVAVALAIPSVANAQTAEPNAYSVVQKPVRKAKVRVKMVRKAKPGTAKSQPKAPEAERPAQIAEGPDAGRRGAKVAVPPPPCALSQKAADVARRCLTLAQPGEPAPAQMHVAASPAMEPVSEARLASPSRTWLGGVSKAIITTCVKLAENFSADRDERRDAMVADIQWELQHARLKAQEKTKQAVSGSTSTEKQPRRLAGL